MSNAMLYAGRRTETKGHFLERLDIQVALVLFLGGSFITALDILI